MRMLGKIAGTVALVLPLLGGPGFAEELKAYTYIESAVTPAYRGLEQMAADVETATNGAVTIKANIGGSLPIKASNITQAIADGVLDVADDMAFVGNVKLGGLIRLPFLIRSGDEYEKAKAVWLPKVQEELAAMGVHFLAEYHYPAQVFFSGPEIKSLSDIKGKKIRVSSAEQGEFIQAAGGTPVTLAPPDVPPALQTGVIDGVLTASAGGGRVWREFFEFNYRLPVNWTNSMLVVNEDVWKGLTEEQQQALQSAAEKAAKTIQDELTNSEEQATKEFADTGMTVTVPGDAEQTEAQNLIGDYWNNWAKERGEQAVAALKEMREAVGR